MSSSPSSSFTRTQSGTSSFTSSPSVTLSASQSQSPSSSSTASASITASVTGSPSQTQSQTPTVSTSRSVSQSSSQTTTSSSSITPSISITSSLSTSPSMSTTASQLASRSQSQSSSQAASFSPTLSPSGASTPSQSATFSPSASSSQSKSASLSGTSSNAATPSGMQTPTASRSATLTTTSSGQQTCSNSPTDSPSSSSKETHTSSSMSTQSTTGSRTTSETPSSSSSPTSSAGLPASCLNGLLDAGESDIDCGGALCAFCAPGRSCTVATDCDTTLGNTTGTILVPESPSVACNPLTLLCEDVRTSSSAWGGSASPQPSFVAFLLRLEGLRSPGLTARTFRALQTSVSASLTAATPSCLISSTQVLVVGATAAPLAASRRLPVTPGNSSMPRSNATLVRVWLLLPRDVSTGTATAALGAVGAGLASAAAAACTAAAPGYAVDRTAIASSSALTEVAVVDPLLPPFPLAVAVGRGDTAVASGGGSLAPWAIALAVIGAILGAIACAVALLVLAAGAGWWRRRGAKAPVLLGASPKSAAAGTAELDAPKPRSRPPSARAASSVRLAADALRSAGARAAGQAAGGAAYQATVFPVPQSPASSASPPRPAGLVVNPIMSHVEVISAGSSSSGGASANVRSGAPAMLGNPLSVALSGAPPKPSPHLLLAGYRSARLLPGAQPLPPGGGGSSTARSASTTTGPATRVSSERASGVTSGTLVTPTEVGRVHNPLALQRRQKPVGGDEAAADERAGRSLQAPTTREVASLVAAREPLSSSAILLGPHAASGSMLVLAAGAPTAAAPLSPLLHRAFSSPVRQLGGAQAGVAPTPRVPGGLSKPLSSRRVPPGAPVPPSSNAGLLSSRRTLALAASVGALAPPHDRSSSSPAKNGGVEVNSDGRPTSVESTPQRRDLLAGATARGSAEGSQKSALTPTSPPAGDAGSPSDSSASNARARAFFRNAHIAARLQASANVHLAHAGAETVCAVVAASVAMSVGESM